MRPGDGLADDADDTAGPCWDGRMEIRLEAIQKRYGDVEVIANLSLTLPSGRVVALLGPSGCGKTTTLRMIAGLERVSGGRLFIGDDLVDDGAGTFVPPERRGLGMVFQSYALWPHLSVLENVAYPLKLRGLKGTERDDLARKALARVRLEHLAARRPDQLSGGQQQRVAVARAIVGDGHKAPPVLLLDEPLANLDAKLREEMRSELATLARESGATVVVVTHDQQEAFSLADSVVVLDGGALAQQGSPEDIYLRPSTPFVGAFGGAMTFLDAHKAGHQVKVGDVIIDGDHHGDVDDGPVRLGLRPEWLRARDAANTTNPTNAADTGLAAVVLQRSFLGREHELRLGLGGVDGPTLLYRLPSTAVAPEVGATWHLIPERVCLFQPLSPRAGPKA